MDGRRKDVISSSSMVQLNKARDTRVALALYGGFLKIKLIGDEASLNTIPPRSDRRSFG
jgi:hypothetical protein